MLWFFVKRETKCPKKWNIPDNILCLNLYKIRETKYGSENWGI